MLDHKIPPPVVGLTMAAAMWWLASFTPVLAVPDWLRWGLGAVLAAWGMSFDLRGLLAFRRARTTVNPLRPQRASSLVTEGVYRTTRNPMYVGMAILLVAWAVALAAPAALLGPALFVAYITRFQILPEERALLARFGDDFTTYRTQVPRWL